MRDGRVRNASFTDYLMPTVLDMPPVRMSISETPHPHAPYGLNGVGEMPTIASTPGRGRRRARRHRARAAARAADARPTSPGSSERRRRTAAGFVGRLGHVAEGSPVGGRARLGLGPFAEREAVAEAFARVVREAPRRGAARPDPRAPRPGRAGRPGRRADPRVGRRAGVGGPRPPDAAATWPASPGSTTPTARASASPS